MKVMPFVLLESPWRSSVIDIRRRNKLYAQRCLLDSVHRDEVPLAGHLLYTQILDDDDPTERRQGIELHMSWMLKFNKEKDFMAVYQDYGVSQGMLQAIFLATDIGLKIENRYIGLNDEDNSN